MSNVIIRAEGIGKAYLIGHEAEPGRDVTLRDTIMSNASRMKRSAGDLIRGRPLIVGDEVEEFWALRDVNFEIRRGDVVGIIGRNGAGKSTLLKVLSRITEPTEGRVTIEGRVASLLEVGTGFHPELSGRENIFLNGSILGMTRKEIQSNFDEIVDFSGVEKFIDTPVKRYSSGMQVRLAFAVAAHLEPEILIVDEVLAVGDAEFQKKCLGKMQDVASGGRTVLFVSHNMAAVQSLCTRGILLENGQSAYNGTINEAIEQYILKSENTATSLSNISEARRKGDGRARFSSVTVLDENGKTIVKSSGTLKIEFKIHVVEEIPEPAEISFSIRSITGAPLLLGSSGHFGQTFSLEMGENTVTCEVASLPIAQGQYLVNCACSTRGRFIDWVEDATILHIVDPFSREWKKYPPPDASLLLIDQKWNAK